MRKLFYAPLILILIASCGNAKGTAPKAVPPDEWMDGEAHSLVSSMSPEEKASQVIMTGIYGNEKFERYLYRYFADAVPGTILLFRYNIADSPEKVASYLDSCNRAFDSLGSRVPVLFAIDHEGGDVFRTGGVTSGLPSARYVAQKAGIAEAEKLYGLSGSQLVSLGIRMNIAPVAEKETAGNADFLGTRSYSDKSETVIGFAGSAVRGYRKAGMLTVLKHFPGNGSGDPHATLPRLDVTRKELLERYADTFRSLIAEKPDAVLVSHILVPSVDSAPFCLSRKGVTGILREELAFDGVIMTDDISMGALADSGYSPKDAAIGALKAGCDMVMSSDPDIGSLVSAIAETAASDPDFASRLDDAVLRILAMKARVGLVKTSLERYSDSRYGNNTAGMAWSDSARDRFYAARKNAELLLEDMK